MINIQLREASFCLDCGCCRSVTSFWLAPINHIGQPQTALRALKAAAHFLRRSHVSYGARHSAVYVNGEQLTFLASLHYCVQRLFSTECFWLLSTVCAEVGHILATKQTQNCPQLFLGGNHSLCSAADVAATHNNNATKPGKVQVCTKLCLAQGKPVISFYTLLCHFLHCLATGQPVFFRPVAWTHREGKIVSKLPEDGKI